MSNKHKNQPDAKPPEETKPTPEEIAKAEADEKAKAEADEKAKAEADEKAKAEADEKAKAEADEKQSVFQIYETMDGGTTFAQGKKMRIVLDGRGCFLRHEEMEDDARRRRGPGDDRSGFKLPA